MANSRIDFAIIHQHRRQWLWLILLLYLLLAIGYGIATPMYEAPDENLHYNTVKAIKSTQRLPVVADGHPAGQEAAQSPLYYLLSALITTPFKGEAIKIDHNPFNNYATKLEIPSQNLNQFIHTPQESWPWQGHVFMLHIIRLFSTCIGLLTLLFVYASGRLLWETQASVALLATALIGFLPQFIFINSSVSNDSLIIMMSTAVLWQLIRIWIKGPTTFSLIALGFTIGIAILSKMTGLLLLGYALGVLFLLALRNGNWRSLVKATLIVTFTSLFLAGWMLWRNWVLYGDLTATNQFIALAGGNRNYTLQQVWQEMDRVWYSIFAYFGWMAIRAPNWVYTIWHSLIIGAIVGVVMAWMHRRKSEFSTTSRTVADRIHFYLNQPGFIAVWLAIWCLLVILAWLNFMIQTSADQGRLWFPALLPVSLGMAYGLSQLPKHIGVIFGPLMALITSIYCLFGLIIPTYAAPDVILETAIPATASTLNVDMGHGLTLLAVDIETTTAVPGELIYTTLYWLAENPPKTPSHLTITGTGREKEPVALLHTLHGGGIFPASAWLPGQIIADRLAIPLDNETAVPIQVRLWAKLENGTQSVEIGRLKAAPDMQPEIHSNPLAIMGERIQLIEAKIDSSQVQPGDTVQVQLKWQALAPLAEPLTVFVHLGEPTQSPLAQSDAPPLRGEFPTQLWDTGDIVSDTYNLILPDTMPSGEYPLYTGFYDSNSGERLSIEINGDMLPYDSYKVDSIIIDKAP